MNKKPRESKEDKEKREKEVLKKATDRAIEINREALKKLGEL